MDRRRRISLLAAPAALGILALSAAPAHALQLGLDEPHSPNAETISTSYWVMIAITAIVLIVVNAALIAAIVRFRERRGHEIRRTSAGRGALRGVVTGLALATIAIAVFGIVTSEDARELEATGPQGLGGTATAQAGVDGLPSAGLLGNEAPGVEAGGPLVIDATAQQWLWRFEHPGGTAGNRTFSYGELVVPVDTTVVLELTSTDVIHSWWVPALGGQAQAVPGSVTRTWFKADEVGRYEGRSTVFSGPGYPAMRAWVRVVSAEEYEAYLDDLRADLAEAQTAVQSAQEEAAEPSERAAETAPETEATETEPEPAGAAGSDGAPESGEPEAGEGATEPAAEEGAQG